MQANAVASCPFCFGQMVRQIEGGTGKRLEWKVCTFCGAQSEIPWLEHQWGEPESEPESTIKKTRAAVV